ncbi:thioredoxin-like protein [Ceratobasidium sp. AG-I]|nr:thioredoxin-like protein [Ceratobasidium sp. AG-I]
MSKPYNRELTDPFQPKSRGVPAFLRKKRYVLLVVLLVALVWIYGTHGPYQRAVRTQEHELEDLLEFFVAAPNQALPVDLDPSAELSQISLRAAAGGKRAKIPPVVVFSKTYCPYSKRAKNLLASMRLKPEPFIVEVDLRDDAETVKALLMRLTGHGTFPNVIVQRKSIGGSDDLVQLHGSGELVKLLGAAGVKAGVA